MLSKVEHVKDKSRNFLGEGAALEEVAWIHPLLNQAESQLGKLAFISDSKLPFPVIPPVPGRARVSFSR